MSKETKHSNARSKVATIYNKLDEACGFKEQDKQKAKEQQQKKGYSGCPEICKTCVYRRNWCWTGYVKREVCKENYCQLYKVDEAEKKHREEIAEAIAFQKGEGSGKKNREEKK